LSGVFPLLIDPVPILGIWGTQATPFLPRAEDPLATAVEHARDEFARQIQTANGEALLVTAEASPNEAGYSMVLQADGQDYLYHIGSDGAAHLINADFHFNEAVGAWHAIASRPSRSAPHPAANNVTAPAASKPGIAVESTSSGAIAYFARLGRNQPDTGHHRNQEEPLRQISSGSADMSLLVLSAIAPHSNRNGEALFDSVLARSHEENANFDLSDIDGAFDSLSTLQTTNGLRTWQFVER
jgi:hypothetical protein